MRTIKTSTGVDITLDGDLLAVIEALYHDVTVQLDLDRTFEDMMQEIQHLVDQMTDDGRREYLVESLFLNTVTYENERLGALHAASCRTSKRAAPVSLNYLATRFRCSWPWETAVLLCDGRVVCGCADPYGKRVLGDARTTRSARSGPARRPSPLRRDLNAGGSDVLRRLPAQAAARGRRTGRSGR